MKLRHTSFLILALLVLLDSCIPAILLPNCIKPFSAFKYPVTDSDKYCSLKMNGLYISDNGKAAFFLYKNGKIKIHSPLFSLYEKKFWVTPDKVIQEMQDALYFNSKEWWGDYVVMNNEIKFQWFNRHNQEICKRWVFGGRGKIVNDSTIEIYLDYSTRGDDESPNVQCLLHFYPVAIKPDSTKAWFNNKKWYKTKLHESRKVQ